MLRALLFFLRFLASSLQRFFPKTWESVKNFAHPRVVTMLFFGFSAGLPILLIFSSLSLWLREAGVQRSAVTFFSWAALGYSFKFIWAPLVDQMPIPIISRKLGRRRAWILLAQICITASIFAMSMIDPAKAGNYLYLMALAAVGLGFSSATQDIAIDAYRIESAGESLQALMASVYIAGYRIGMLAAGAGALFLAQIKGSVLGAYDYAAWRTAYQIMAGLMAIGMITVFVIEEPEVTAKETNHTRITDHARFFGLFLVSAAAFVGWFYFSSGITPTLKEQVIFVVKNSSAAGLIIETGRLAGGICVGLLAARVMVALKVADMEMIRSAYVEPVSDFFSRYGLSLAWLLLSLIGLYRISDIVLGVISNVFYQDMGFSKIHIASIVKTFGLFMTIAGGFLGGHPVYSIRGDAHSFCRGIAVSAYKPFVCNYGLDRTGPAHALHCDFRGQSGRWPGWRCFCGLFIQSDQCPVHCHSICRIFVINDPCAKDVFRIFREHGGSTRLPCVFHHNRRDGCPGSRFNSDLRGSIAS